MTTENSGLKTYEEKISIAKNGHLRIENEILLSPEDAVLELSKNPLKYRRAKAVGEKIALIFDSYECFSCGEIFYASYNIEDDILKSFFDWAMQKSFFKSASEFALSREVFSKAECDLCNYEKRIATKISEYTLKVENRKISLVQMIGHKLADDKIGGTKELSENIYPIRVELVFDVDARKTTIAIFGSFEIPINFLDITDMPDKMHEYTIIRKVSEIRKIKRALANSFSSFSGTVFPYDIDELDIKKLILLNSFQGYSRKFYDCLPIDIITGKLDGSFLEIAKELGSINNLPALYDRLALPKSKAIKRAIMQNPAFLFYAEQINNLPFKNKDIILKVLNGRYVFRLLNYLRRFSKLGEFLRIFIEDCGENAVYGHISQHIDHALIDIAARYFFVDNIERGRLATRIFYGKNVYEPGLANIEVNYGYDCMHIFENCEIDGFTFRVTKSTNEMHNIGYSLENCLRYNYDADSSDIISVWEGGKIVAAAEVSYAFPDKSYKICQVSGVSGRSIKSNPRLWLAYKKWCFLKQITYFSRGD